MRGVPDPYQTLGVARDATAADIKKAYRKLAVKYHPDRTGGDAAKETKFKEISTAYEILGDPEKRARYDAMGATGAGGGFPGGVDLGDLFSQVFSGAAGKGGAGFDYQAFRGGQGGRSGGFDFGSFGVPPRRRPRGPSRPAPPRERVVRAADGTALTQRGTDVHSDVRLQFDQAILGTVAEVATMAGKAKVKIPPATPSGVKLRLKGKGASREDGSRGDHYVTVHIDVPKTIDEESTRLLTKLMKRLRKDER